MNKEAQKTIAAISEGADEVYFVLSWSKRIPSAR